MDHDLRRRELADAVCRVIAREGLGNVSLRRVADEAGWSIGSMRYYFTTKEDLLEFALGRAGDRIEDRLTDLCQDPRMTARLRAVVLELLPLDAVRHEESLVWLSFVAHAAVDPKLASLAAEVWSRLHAAFVGLVAAAVEAGEMPATLDVERESTRLQALVDGLVVHLVTMPSQMSPDHAVRVVDTHLDSLIVTELSVDPA